MEEFPNERFATQRRDIRRALRFAWHSGTTASVRHEPATSTRAVNVHGAGQRVMCHTGQEGTENRVNLADQTDRAYRAVTSRLRANHAWSFGRRESPTFT